MFRRSRQSKGLVTPFDLFIVAIAFYLVVGILMILMFFSAKDMIISKNEIYLSKEIDDRGSELVSILGATSLGVSNMELAGDTIIPDYETHIGEYLVALDEMMKDIDSFHKLELPGRSFSISTPATSSICIYDDSAASTMKMQWPMQGTRISDMPGWRDHPIEKTCKCHAGVDIAGDKIEVVAAAHGTVSRVQRLSTGYGNNVMIDHDREWTGYQTLYGHLDTIDVKEGDVVNPGQRIGLSGDSGSSTAPHLHFEVRKSARPVDPCSYFDFTPSECSVSDRCIVRISRESYDCQVPIPGAQSGNLKEKVELVI